MSFEHIKFNPNTDHLAHVRDSKVIGIMNLDKTENGDPIIIYKDNDGNEAVSTMGDFTSDI